MILKLFFKNVYLKNYSSYPGANLRGFQFATITFYNLFLLSSPTKYINQGEKKKKRE
jgi:hypothetical protein